MTKQTIRLDVLRSVVVQPGATGQDVRIELQTMGITAIAQNIEINQAMALGNAIRLCAEQAALTFQNKQRILNNIVAATVAK